MLILAFLVRPLVVPESTDSAEAQVILMLGAILAIVHVCMESSKSTWKKMGGLCRAVTGDAAPTNSDAYHHVRRRWVRVNRQSRTGPKEAFF